MTEQKQMITFTIDGKSLTVPKGTTVYQAAKQLEIEIPIFCYHDRMPPFGACRMCLVEVEKMSKLQTSCTLEASEGMVVKTQTQPAVDGRKEIIEFLLLNHPLDCPICDRGGECPLQENALRYGPGMSRFFEEKRHFTKPKPLGPVLMLDRERCIVCARCTRFGDVVAGDHALEFMERGFKTEVGTPDGGPAESKYIGNTIQICPVGALTSQVYRFRARPWDNDPTDTTCTLCPVGCSMILDSRDGQIMRTRARENHAVNDIWMCDKGWFGYEYITHPERLQYPLIRKNGTLVQSSWEETLSLVAEKIKVARPTRKLAAFGGNPLTFEENYLFQKLMREGAHVDHLDHRIGMPLFSLEEEGLAPGMEIEIAETENLSHALLFGLDLTEEFPVIWLRLRQAINKGAKVIFSGHFAPEIAPYLSEVILHSPGDEIEHIQKLLSKLPKEGKGALFIGRQYLSSPNRKAILAEMIKHRGNFSLNIMEGKGNSVGARLAGMRPDLGPLNKQHEKPGFNAVQVLENTIQSGWEFLYVAGANPALQYPASVWSEARANLRFLVVQDLFMTETAQQADVVLPTLSFVEKGGTFINIEQRLQPLLPGKEIPRSLLSDGEIFMEIGKKLHLDMTIDSEFSDSLSQKKISLDRPKTVQSSTPFKPPEEGLKATFAISLFDHGVRMKHDPHLIQMSKAPYIRIHPQEGQKHNIKDGDIVQVISGDRIISGKVKWDERVALNTVVLPLGFESIFPVHQLNMTLLNGISIKLSR